MSMVKKKKKMEQSSTFEEKAFHSISPSGMKSSITLDSVTQRGSVQAPHQLTSLMTNGGRLIVRWPQGGVCAWVSPGTLGAAQAVHGPTVPLQDSPAWLPPVNPVLSCPPHLQGPQEGMT